MRHLLIVAITVAVFFTATDIYGHALLLLTALLVSQLVAPAPPKIAVALVAVTTALVVSLFGAFADHRYGAWIVARVVDSTAILVIAALIAVGVAQLINNRRALRSASH